MLRRWSHVAAGPLPLAVVLALLLALGVAACGGDGGGGGGGDDVPVISGADEIESQDASDDQLEELGFAASDGKATAYKTDKSLDEVSDFYDDLEDGWDVAMSMPIGDQYVAVLSKGKTVAFVSAMTGAYAKENPDMVGDEDFEIDVEDIDDDDTLVLVAEFTCDEENIEDCVAGFTQ